MEVVTKLVALFGSGLVGDKVEVMVLVVKVVVDMLRSAGGVVLMH